MVGIGVVDLAQLENNVTCPICKYNFRVKPSRLKRSKNICCSRSCANELRKITMKDKGNHQYGVRGKKNSSYQGGRKINNKGYVEVLNRDHPMSRFGYILEHRLVAEKHLLNDENSIEIDGKLYLSPDYIVHHIDGVPNNNSVNNLEIMTKSEHSSFHCEIRPRNRDLKTGRFVE